MTADAASQTAIIARIARELGARDQQVAAAVGLLDEGSTVPFIARYRKEATGGLDDTQLRTLEERLSYLRDMEERRAAILSAIDEQGKLTPELAADIKAADTKTRLEDLYLPYKQKRRTKASIAREAGLEPLALALLENPALSPETVAAEYVDEGKGVADVKAALDGARHILVEKFGEDAALVGRLRDKMKDEGVVAAKVIEEKRAEGAKFSDYFDHAEPWRAMPSHRVLALLRGRAQGVLDIRLDLPVEEGQPHPAETIVAAHAGIRNEGRPADKWLSDVARWTWKLKIGPHVETDLMSDLRERAEEEAIRVFARNLHDLLLAAPAGRRTVLGLDPGIRTGVKAAVVDDTGKLLDTATVYPLQPKNDWDGAIATLAALCRKHGVALVGVGNGTASRETDQLVADLMKRHPELPLSKAMVSEAGASVYSASELAAAEFPKLDVSLRGAVSIARRLQDPLAELVKIDPKSIGVGQYQHDVTPGKLARSLDAVVEDCVNAVGVDLNTASVPLLARVSGLSETVARNVVAFRDANGAFKSRKQLLEVPRLGPKAFEQAAGFLRIQDGDNPLDGSSVHPEAYPVVERILKKTGRQLGSLIGDARFLRALDVEAFTDERFGAPTVGDILKELEKPGRDPRPEFKTATFKEGVAEMKDLQPGMLLEGVVTNVAAFGAFVDIGVHQDGLVHVSQLADRFVKDPHEVVKAGDVVKVRVQEVDIPRKRISLTMRLADKPAPQQNRPATGQGDKRGPGKPQQRQDAPAKPQPRRDEGPTAFGGAFAEAMQRAKGKK
ncbi:MAG TPA: Tex family protein [Azospirillaceae bacterium]|nr:Tex family protein [Azospirillaceae bacterium]